MSSTRAVRGDERCEFPLNAYTASSYPCFASGACRATTAEVMVESAGVPFFVTS